MCSMNSKAIIIPCVRTKKQEARRNTFRRMGKPSQAIPKAEA